MYALVTGAASGIGRRAVERLLERGADIVATDVNEEIHAVFAAEPHVHTVVFDVTDPSFGPSLIDATLSHLPRLDMVIHCAGVMPGGPVSDVPVEKALSVMDINYGGTVRLIEAALPVLRKSGTRKKPSQLVVMGSLTGYVPMQKLAAYSASKAAVNSYVEILAEEERGKGVHVLLVAPITVRTPLLEQATGGPQFIESLAGKMSGLLMVDTDDVLDAVDRGLDRGAAVVIPGGRLPLLGRRVSRRFAWWATNLFN